MRISHIRFQKIARKCWLSILKKMPEDIRTAAENIAVIAADLPAENFDSDAFNLLGIYEGISVTDQTAGQTMLSPDIICIFRIPLMNSCSNERTLRKEIRITLLHELGHHLGFDEEELASRGLD